MDESKSIRLTILENRLARKLNLISVCRSPTSRLRKYTLTTNLILQIIWVRMCVFLLKKLDKGCVCCVTRGLTKSRSTSSMRSIRTQVPSNASCRIYIRFPSRVVLLHWGCSDVCSIPTTSNHPLSMEQLPRLPHRSRHLT